MPQTKPIEYTQDDLDRPTKFLGEVADRLNQLIVQVSGENPVETVDAVSLAEALAFKRGQIDEPTLRSRVFKAEKPAQAS